jgi:hypothetical protein
MGVVTETGICKKHPRGSRPNLDLGPISAFRQKPSGTENGHGQTRCGFPRVLSFINRDIAIKGPAASAQIKIENREGRSWEVSALESRPGKEPSAKNRCEKHFGAASQLVLVNSRLLQMGKRLASYFFGYCTALSAVLGLLAQVQSSLFAPASYNRMREMTAPPRTPFLGGGGGGAGFSLTCALQRCLS